MDDPKEFEKWLGHFRNYLNVVEITQQLTSGQNHSLLLNCVGEDVEEIVSGFNYDSDNK